MPDCREVSRLVLAGEDRRLRCSERARVRWHLLLCAGCRGFVQQVALMRQALRRWRDDAADADADADNPAEPTGAPGPSGTPR